MLNAPGAAVFRGAAALLTTQPLTWAASLAAAVMLPHYLGSRGLGQLAVVSVIAGTTGTLVGLGVPTHLVQLLSRRPESLNSQASAALLMVTCSGLLAGMALAVLLPLVSIPIEHRMVLYLAMGGMIIAAQTAVLQSILVAQERHGMYAMLNAAAGVATTGVGLTAIALRRDLGAYMVATVCSSAVALLAVWFTLRLRFARAAFDLSVWRRLALGGLPLLGFGIAMQVRAQIDLVMAASLTSEQVAGWLAAAYRIISVPVFIPTVIVTPLLPALSRTTNRAAFGRALESSLLAVLLLTVTAAGGIAAAAQYLPGLLHWPADFQHSVPLIMILAWQQPIVAVDMVLGTALIALDDKHRWLQVACIAAAFNPTVNFVAMPVAQHYLHNGAIGAAIVELLTECVMLVGALLLLPRGLIASATTYRGFRIVLAGACFGNVPILIGRLPLMLALLLGSAVYVAVLVGTRAVRLSDIRAIEAVAPMGFRNRLVQLTGARGRL